jgi:serine/threonine protein kinase
VYLHSIGIMHRDLKPEDIVMHSDEDNNYDIKIADFSMACGIKPNAGDITKQLGDSAS